MGCPAPPQTPLVLVWGAQGWQSHHSRKSRQLWSLPGLPSQAVPARSPAGRVLDGHRQGHPNPSTACSGGPGWCVRVTARLCCHPSEGQQRGKAWSLLWLPVPQGELLGSWG